MRVADALKARDAGVTTALVVPREGVLPGRSVLINLAGDKAEAMALKQPAALHLHMATLARAVPGLADGHGGLRAPGPARRRALPRGVGRLREGAARAASGPRYDAGARRLAGRAGRQAAAGRDRAPARTTSGARWPWPTSSRCKVVVAGATQAQSRGGPDQGAQAAAAGQRELRPAARRRRPSAARTRRRRGATSRRRREPGRAAQGRRAPSRSSPATPPTSWPACARRSSAGCRARPRCGRSRWRRRRCWAWPTGWAAWRRARSRTSWRGRASR